MTMAKNFKELQEKMPREARLRSEQLVEQFARGERRLDPRDGVDEIRLLAHPHRLAAVELGCGEQVRARQASERRDRAANLGLGIAEVGSQADECMNLQAGAASGGRAGPLRPRRWRPVWRSVRVVRDGPRRFRASSICLLRVGSLLKKGDRHFVKDSEAVVLKKGTVTS